MLHFAHKLEQKSEPQKTSSLSRPFVEEQQQRILGEGGVEGMQWSSAGVDSSVETDQVWLQNYKNSQKKAS
jgi:hypothetical protein